MATLQNIGVLKYRDKNGKWQPLPVVLQGAGGAGGVTTISGNGVPNTSTVGRVNQLYRDEATDKLYICTGTDGAYTWAAVVSDTEDAVKYTGQTLTNVQKAQARANIGAGTSNFSGAYNDLTGKPNIPAAAVIDTTLTKAGQAADAKAVGDKITEVNGKVEDKLDATALPTAVNNALAQAKASGAFDGAKGEKGDPGEDGQAGTPGQNGVSPHIGTNGNWWIGTTDTGVSATGGSYTLPVATPDALGGVKPIGKTAAMTQDVGVDADGKLYTAPSGGGTDKSLGIASATVGQIAKITAVDGTGKPTGWKAFGWETIADIIVEDENIYYYKWDVNDKSEFIMMVSLTPLTNSNQRINGIAGLNAAGTPWNQDAIRITGNIQSVMSTEIGNTYIISGKKTDNKWTPGCFMKSSNSQSAHTTIVPGGSWYTAPIAIGGTDPLSFPEIGEITNIAVGSYTKFFGVGSHIQIIAR